MLKKQNKIRPDNKILSISQCDILPNPNQPRKRFDYDELEGLAQSIRANGILQPLIVRELENGKYGFETITFCPFEREAILTELLTEKEKAWLNAYHARVCDTLKPLFSSEELKWLEAEAAEI